MASFTDDLTVGRGRLYFDRFEKGTQNKTGEMFFGNCSELTFSSSSETLDHYSSTSGIKTKDSSITISVDRSGAITVDNISADNLALAYAGEASSLVTTSAIGVVNTFTIKEGRFYQLGVTSSNPTGARNVSNVVVEKLGGTIAATGNYEVDTVLGRIYIEPGATALNDDDIIEVTFDVATSTRTQIKSSNESLFGALHYVEDNGVGTNRDFFFPYVKLTADGDFSLIGDDWQTLGFSFSALKLNSATSDLYIDGRAA